MTIKQLYTIFLECNAICTDTRKLKQNNLFVALKGDNFDGNTYAEEALQNGAKYAIIDNKKFCKSKNTILVKNTLRTLQELATFHRKQLKTPIIALTGSNGKTTTKELINTVLSQKYITTATKGNLNNHIGVPLTLLSITQNTEIAIIEMGANHQKEIEFLCNIALPDYGLITNFGKAHLEGFGGIEGVIKGKSEMFTHLSSRNKTLFINKEDNIQVEKSKNAKVFSFSSDSKKSNISITFITAQPFVKCKYDNLEIASRLIGDYNFNNIAFAIAIGVFFKVNAKNIRIAIENYIPENNRSQIIMYNENKIILDAYNANPTSMRAALLNFEQQKGNKIAILGDMFELGKVARIEHKNIIELADSLSIDTLYFVGKNFFNISIDSKKIKQFETFDNFNTSVNIKALSKSTILIKGSRGMALERFLKTKL